MTDQKIIESHHLTITFDQLENNQVNWTITPNDAVAQISSADRRSLAAAEVSLAAIGICVLWELCSAMFIELALERANLAQWQELASWSWPIESDGVGLVDVETGAHC